MPNRAAEMVGLSRAAFWRLLQDGQIKSVKVGSARLIPLDALREWLEQQGA
jgi:excisionase family DNA binding protein